MLIAAALVALAVLVALPATLTAETEPRDAEVVTAEESGPTVDEGTKPSPEANKVTEKSALDKLALKKLAIERPAPEKRTPREVPPQKPTPNESASEKPTPAPDPVLRRNRGPHQSSDRKPRRLAGADATGVPALSSPADKAAPPSSTTPPVAKSALHDNRLLLSIPKLGLDNVPVGDSRRQSYLDREGILHLSGTGFPHEPGSNTYIAGHAGDFESSRVPNVFRNLHDLRQGDLITLRDVTGRTYNYRAYEYLIVNPRDVWVTRPLPGKQIVSLQTCFPAPTFEKRLVIRGELVR